MTRLWTAFKEQLSPAAKIGVIAGLLLIVIIFAAVPAALVSHFKDSAFARREAERESEREQLQRERDQAIGRAQAAEKRERDLAAKVQIQEAVVAAAGTKAEAAATKIQEENTRYETDMRDAGQPVDPDERCKRICARLAKIYPGAKCACEGQ